jgi:hypothetical protein
MLPAFTHHTLPDGSRLMERRVYGLTLPFAGLVLIAAAGCATVDTAVVASPGAEFTLQVGKTAAISGTDYKITFNRVTEDSRCPVDVVCVWAGDAKIELAIARNSAPADVHVISLTPPNSEVTAGDLKIRFVSLAPNARQSEPPASRAYVARLIVLRP